MNKLLPLLLVVAGIAGGGAAGMMLKSGPDAGAQAVPKAEGAPSGSTAAPGAAGAGALSDSARDYVEIGRQMIVPVVEGDETRALMMFELAIDVPLEMRDIVFLHEPRLRDAFLRVLFEMSHTGAFLDTFTDDLIVEELRRKLLAAAQKLLGPEVSDVLILDIMRQEM